MLFLNEQDSSISMKPQRLTFRWDLKATLRGNEKNELANNRKLG